METEAAHSLITLGVGGTVGTICRFLISSGLHGRWVSFSAAGVAFLFVGVTALDAGDFVRGQYLKYLLQWGEILGLAAGSLKMIDVGADKITEMRTGTGDGR